MKKPLLTLVGIFIFLSGYTQRTWLEANISKKVSKNIKLSIAPEIRFLEGLDLNQYFFDTGLEYDFHKYFRIGTIYRLGNNIRDDSNHEAFGRFALDAKTQYGWDLLKAGITLRYSNTDDFGDKNNDKKNYLRLKFKFNYSVRELNLKPFVVYEICRNLPDKELNKLRYEAGFEYKFYRRYRIGISYRVYDYLNDNDSANLLGAAYLKLRCHFNFEVLNKG